MNYKILGLVGFLAAVFVAAVIWKMDSFVAVDRGNWAQAQLRTQVSALEANTESMVKQLFHQGNIFQDRRDRNFWQSAEPFKAFAWTRDLKNPTLENVNVKEGSGLDDTTLAKSLKELQGLRSTPQKMQFVPWKDNQKKNWLLVVWPWSETKTLILWAPAEMLQAGIENYKGSLADLIFVNESGQILAHSEPEYFGSKATDNPLFQSFKKDGVTQGSLNYQDSSKQKFLGQMASVPRSNILIFATTSEHNLFADKYRVWASFLFLGFGLVLLTLAGLSWIMRTEEKSSLPPQPHQVVVPAPMPVAPVATAAPALTGEEKHGAYKKIAASLGHELRAPMARILGFCQMIMAKEKNTEVQAHVDSIIRETRTARELLDKLFNFAQEKEAVKSKNKIQDLIENVLGRVQPTLSRKHIALVKDIQDTPAINVMAPLIEKALENILQNSIEALERRLNKEIKISSSQKGNQIEIVISDNGEGIEPDNLQKIYDPFYTTRSYAQHLGLGLSAAYGVIHQHGGEIKVESSRGKGTDVIITLPEQEITKAEPVKPVIRTPEPEPVSFSPADVEIEKLMDLPLGEEFPETLAPMDEVETVAIDMSKFNAKFDMPPMAVEKPKSALDEYQVQIRKPRQKNSGSSN
jgi:signal transduction histidine kinase